MERRKFFTRLGTGTLATCAVIPVMSATMKNPESNPKSVYLEKGEIQHMVIFDLNHEKGSAMAEQFLKDGRQILSRLPMVQRFQVFNQVSLKNDYSYCFSMVFAGQMAYDTYNNHPHHIAFVEDRWKKEVARFMEIDFKSH